jgi:pimeloyl-ACP methyl ester carboxylesterase
VAHFVLVPGAWLGGWAWDEVASRLRARGHDVDALTLSGLEGAEGAESVDLDQQVADIVEAIERSALRDVVLVGHSYGGWPVTGAADAIPERLSRVVYVDSGPARDGLSYLDTLPQELREVTERHAREEGGGRLLPMPSWGELEQVNGASAEGIDEEARAAIHERSRPQPFLTHTQPISLTNPERTTLPHLLVSCSLPLDQVRAMIDSGHPWFAEMAGPQWSSRELLTSHWPMFSAPAGLADALDG